MILRRATASVVAISVSFSAMSAGCATPRGRANGLIAAGAATAMAGPVMTGVCEAGNVYQEGVTLGFADTEPCPANGGLIAVGLALLIAGVLVRTSLAGPDDAPVAGRGTPTPPIINGEPSAVPPSLTVPGYESPPPTSRAALPERPVDELTLQLARTARRAATEGNCEVAELAVSRLGQRDPEYRAALVAGPALFGCALPAVEKVPDPAAFATP